ncbi:MAG: hypothetical protein GY953_47220 [bacterium]|nr:hypothetical protein [bacterium]
MAAEHEDGHAVEVDIFSTANLWPLPWYLREFPNVRWWRGVSGDTPLAPIILATPEMEAALVERMYESPAPGQSELYMHMFDERLDLRPGVEVRGFIPKSLWDRLR